MKSMCTAIKGMVLALALLLAAGCSLTVDVKPTHQLQWVSADPQTNQPAQDPEP